MTPSQNSQGFHALCIDFALWEWAFYQTGDVFLRDMKNCEGSISIILLLLRRGQSGLVPDRKILQPAIPAQAHASRSKAPQRKSDLGQLVPAINTLPPRGIEIFRRVRFCPAGHRGLLLKSKRLFTESKFQAVNF